MKRGDIVQLGRHRLLCSDCTDASGVAALLAGTQVSVVITSPPYASQRAYDPASGFQPVKPGAYVDWYRPVAQIIATHLAPDGSYFLNIKEHCEQGQRSLYVKDLTLAHVRAWGWRFVDEFCWHRKGVPGGWTNRFKNEWEPVFHFTRQASIKFRPWAVSHATHAAFRYNPARHKTPAGLLSGRRGDDGQSGHDDEHDGLARPGNHLTVQTGEFVAAAAHVATFPIGLPTFFITAFSDEGDSVYDPFMGSGTTLIAAQQLGRVAYGCEISPVYCQVIIDRWERLTGQQAVMAHEEVAA